MRSVRRHLLALGLLVLAAPSHAQDAPPPVEVHGYGSWAYGRTDRNSFLAGTPRGDYSLVSMALNLSKRIDDQLSIHAQGFITEAQDVSHASLEFAFVDYRVNHFLALRIGKIKHPFGIYTEVFDVGTLRPFLDLPQAVYGPVGFAGQSYEGIGVAGAADAGAWTLAYDAYAGGNSLQELGAAEEFYQGRSSQSLSQGMEEESTRDVVGGRLIVQTPIQGLTVGGSSYTGILNEPASNRRSVVAGQIGFRTNTLTLESELAHMTQVDDESALGGYLLAAWRFTPEWQVAAQLNRLTDNFSNVDVSAAPSLQQHREVAFALSRWVSRAFVVKAEYHRVTGNRFAMPDPQELAATVAAKELRVTTHLVQFGAQFAF
jgi:hypothetical protein